MKIKWLKTLESNQIAVSYQQFQDLLEPEKLTIHLGSLKRELKVTVKKELEAETLGLPLNLSDTYTIPKNLFYDCFIRAGEVRIGPVIAIISGGKLSRLNRKIFNAYLPKFLDYPSIRGLIVLCNKDSIDVISGRVKGFYFNPEFKEPRQAWQYGEFPLPNAIINRSFISQEKISAIQEKLGDNLFNSYYLNLDKWSIWEHLSKNATLKKHLPYTEKFEDGKQLEALLQRFDSLYLKPSNSSQGRGMLKIDKLEKGISLIDFKRQTRYFDTYQQLEKFLRTNLISPYIIQQSVHLKKDNRHVDFRLVLQRDATKKWQCSGIVARIGLADSIITNSRGRETSIVGIEALSTIFKISEKEAEKLAEEMTQLVIRAVGRYEERGLHLGDLAADMAVDANLNIWLLELQLNYGLDPRSTVINYEFLARLINTPFRYAKALTESF